MDPGDLYPRLVITLSAALGLAAAWYFFREFTVTLRRRPIAAGGLARLRRDVAMTAWGLVALYMGGIVAAMVFAAGATPVGLLVIPLFGMVAYVRVAAWIYQRMMQGPRLIPGPIEQALPLKGGRPLGPARGVVSVVIAMIAAPVVISVCIALVLAPAIAVAGLWPR